MLRPCPIELTLNEVNEFEIVAQEENGKILTMVSFCRKHIVELHLLNSSYFTITKLQFPFSYMISVHVF